MATRKPSTDDDTSTAQTVADAAHDAVDRIARSAAEAEARIRESVDAARNKAATGADDAVDKADALRDEVTTAVNQHPVAALGVAFLAGVVVSSMLRR